MVEPAADTSYLAYRVEREGDGARGCVERLRAGDLPDGDVIVRVEYSSLNYKDALSARGRPGVTREYPHTPGIDAAGTVVASRDEHWAPGDPVLVTSYDLGMNTPGGFGELIRVPAGWVVPLPTGLSLREAMVLGTAGFTAAQAVLALERHGLDAEGGPVVVTGASGGVGSMAVSLLAARGYEVVASTGKRDAEGWLGELGASRVIPRSELGSPSQKALHRGVYAGGVDTVGGATLANLLKSVRYGGAVAACGLVQGPELEVNVFPFILRAVALLGIDSAQCPMKRRLEIWDLLAGPWKPEGLERMIAREIGLEELDDAVDEILAGRTRGRVLVRVAA